MLEIFTKIIDILISIILLTISYSVYKGRYKPEKDTMALVIFALGLLIFMR